MQARVSRTVVALLLALAAAATIGACGGGSDEDAQAVLDKAFSTRIESANVSLDMQLSGEGARQLEDPLRVKLTGPYKNNGSKKLPNLDWDLSIAAAGQSFSAGVIATDDNAFVDFQGTAYEVGEDVVARINTQLEQQTGGDQDQSLKALGIDPANWVRDPKTEDDEEVAGTDTTHVTGAVDMTRLLDDLNKAAAKAGEVQGGEVTEIPEEQRKQIAEAVKDPKFDVYVGKDDDILRRLSVDLGFEVPEDQRDQADGLKSGKVSFTVELSDIGDDQEIKAPSDARPIADLLSQFGALGALGGGGTTGPGGTPTDPPAADTAPPPSATTPEPGTPGAGGPTTTGPDPEQAQKYLECIQKADPTDTAALTACSSLIQ